MSVLLLKIDKGRLGVSWVGESEKLKSGENYTKTF